VLRVESGSASLLLTGDIEARAEHLLVSDAAALRAEAVVIPHHGSDTSSSQAFVEAVAARLAIVSAGYRNRWGLPGSGVVDRWRKAGTELMMTSRGGAVSLRGCAESGISKVRKNREKIHRMWHDPAQE
jgi:competence protein ComEC